MGVGKEERPTSNIEIPIVIPVKTGIRCFVFKYYLDFEPAYDVRFEVAMPDRIP